MVWRRPQIGNLPGNLRRFGRNDQVILSVLAAVIGAAVAYAAYSFRVFIAAIQNGAYGFSVENSVANFAALPWWQILFWPTAAGLFIGLLLKFAMPDGRAGGPAEVIEASALQNAQMPVRTGLISALISAVSLGAGASSGREGPVVHLGGSMAAWLARCFGLSVASSVATVMPRAIVGKSFFHW